MKPKFLLILLFFSFNSIIYSQETSKPLTDTEIVRNVSILDIEGKEYKNVIVTLKSVSPDYFITDKHKVKVTVEDMNGKKVWKKTMKNAYLYVFSSGQVQVGQPKFNKIIIEKNYSDSYIGKIREKEGVY